MKILLSTILIFFSIGSYCQHDSIPPPPKPPDMSMYYWDTNVAEITKQSEIFIELDEEFEIFSYKIIGGEKLVFKLQEIRRDYIATSSDKEETVVFQINPDLDRFEYRDEELSEIKCILFVCTDDCWTYSNYNVQNGVIRGEKTETGKWRAIVEINNGKFNTSEYYEVKTSKMIG